MSLITTEEQERVSGAIKAAELRTSGEIVAVVAPESASYLSIPFEIAAAIALIVPWPLIYLTWVTVQWIYGLQLIVFFVLLALLLPRPVRFRLVPRTILASRAHRRAVEQFLAQNLHTTVGRTGVLIFISVAERYAEIIADEGLHTKVTPAEWQSIVDEMTAEIGADRAGAGLVKAVERAGGLLAKHFPPGTGDSHKLPDHLILLD